MFKQISNLMGMMGQMKEMGSKMGEISEELRAKRVTGAAGGGMVEVEMNGANEVLDIRIDDVVMADKEMLLDLLPSAINQAIVKAKELHLESMKSLTGGMDLPGLDEAMAQFSGGPKN
jgi:DNA-binding YbaB/EbfC family protein